MDNLEKVHLPTFWASLLALGAVAAVVGVTVYIVVNRKEEE